MRIYYKQERPLGQRKTLPACITSYVTYYKDMKVTVHVQSSLVITRSLGAIHGRSRYMKGAL